MRITIVYFGQARALVGNRTEQVEVPEGASACEVLRAAAGNHGGEFQRLLFSEQGQLRRSILLAVGNTSCGADERNLLKDGSELAVQTAISGG